jgi:Ca2+-transporting ATPase
MEFFKAYGYRSDHQHVLHRPFVNKWLNLAIGWEIILLLLILYVPFLQHAFGTAPFGPIEWVIIVFLAHTILPVLEFVKWLERRGTLGSTAGVSPADPPA